MCTPQLTGDKGYANLNKMYHYVCLKNDGSAAEVIEKQSPRRRWFKWGGGGTYINLY